MAKKGMVLPLFCSYKGWKLLRCANIKQRQHAVDSLPALRTMSCLNWKTFIVHHSDSVSNLKVLRPSEVVLHEGEALVWFPGWEHETRIQHGLSVSISLHFDTELDSLYVQTFQKFLRERVSSQF